MFSQGCIYIIHIQKINRNEEQDIIDNAYIKVDDIMHISMVLTQNQNSGNIKPYI